MSKNFYFCFTSSIKLINDMKNYSIPSGEVGSRVSLRGDRRAQMLPVLRPAGVPGYLRHSGQTSWPPDGGRGVGNRWCMTATLIVIHSDILIPRFCQLISFNYSIIESHSVIHSFSHWITLNHWSQWCGSGSRGIKSLIKWREKQSLTNKNLYFRRKLYVSILNL